jgi:threonyl-tRNA synthetase
MKVPHMLVLGEREQEAREVSVRYRDGKQENGVALDSYVASLHERIASKQTL